METDAPDGNPTRQDFHSGLKRAYAKNAPAFSQFHTGPAAVNISTYFQRQRSTLKRTVFCLKNGEYLSSRELGESVGREARYYLGMIALEQQQWREALDHFETIVQAKPAQPEYLLPWSYLRTAQAAAQLGDLVMARAMAAAALKSPNVGGVRQAAETLLRDLSKRGA